MHDFHIETDRLIIGELKMDMCADIHRHSLDEDTRRYVPDEVFETLEEAEAAVAFLMQTRHTPDGPFVHPVIRKTDGANIGYVQACRADGGFEIGYHIAKGYTGQGYAAEAVRAFVPQIMQKLQLASLLGVVLEENAASCRVLEKCGFQLVFRGEDFYQGTRRLIRRYLYSRQ